MFREIIWIFFKKVEPLHYIMKIKIANKFVGKYERNYVANQNLDNVNFLDGAQFKAISL